MNIRNEDIIYVVGLADHADGTVYEVEKQLVELPNAFTVALKMLATSSDHVCLIDVDTYSVIPHDITMLSYSINISKGINA